MKKHLIVLLVFAFALTACENLPTEMNDNSGTENSNKVPVLIEHIDDPDLPGDCTVENEEWQAFIKEVMSTFSGEQLKRMHRVLGEPLACALLRCLRENHDNHGQFVSCISHLTNKLKKAGIINGKQKGTIVSIAAQSDIGK